MSRPHVLELSGIELRHPGRDAILRGLDLAIEPGETVVVRGTNGSGKTSLLRIAAGAATATADRHARRPRTVGYVPDRFPAGLRMPAASYLRHMAALHGADPHAAGRAARALLETLGFTGGLTVPMAQLSKGNAQKAALAQALCSGARLLVLDEPFSGLDAGAAAAVHRAIAVAAADGAAVLLTDHTGAAADLPSPRLLRLTGGRLTPDAPSPTAPHRAEPTPGAVLVTLTVPDPRRILASLPAARGLTVGPGRITLTVPLAQRDALLATALALGCGVQGVATTDVPA